MSARPFLGGRIISGATGQNDQNRKHCKLTLIAWREDLGTEAGLL